VWNQGQILLILLVSALIWIGKRMISRIDVGGLPVILSRLIIEHGHPCCEIQLTSSEAVRHSIDIKNEVF